MTVCFCGVKSAGLGKKEEIAELIGARVTLLIGKKYSSYIDSISFCTDLGDWAEDKTSVSIDGQSLAELNTLNKKPASICIRLREELLLNALIPGGGQSQFDELFLKIRDLLCKKI